MTFVEGRGVKQNVCLQGKLSDLHSSVGNPSEPSTNEALLSEVWHMKR